MTNCFFPKNSIPKSVYFMFKSCFNKQYSHYINRTNPLYLTKKQNNKISFHCIATDMYTEPQMQLNCSSLKRNTFFIHQNLITMSNHR